MRRTRPQLSAGSMADIAFLLLVFFLLVTRINQESGIASTLAPVEEHEGAVPERNLIRVHLGSQGEMMIRDREGTLVDLQEVVTRFYENSGVMAERGADNNYPLRKWIDEHQAQSSTPEVRVTFLQIGRFRKLPAPAYIQIRSREDTPYDWYMEVLDHIEGVRNDFRDELCQEISGRSLRNLDANNERDKAMLIASKVVYPNRVTDYWEQE